MACNNLESSRLNRREIDNGGLVCELDGSTRFAQMPTPLVTTSVENASH